MPRPDPRAQLSAISTALDDLTARVTALAESLDHRDTEAVAALVYEVERSLRTARRALARAGRALG